MLGKSLKMTYPAQDIAITFTLSPCSYHHSAGRSSRHSNSWLLFHDFMHGLPGPCEVYLVLGAANLYRNLPGDEGYIVLLEHRA